MYLCVIMHTTSEVCTLFPSVFMRKFNENNKKKYIKRKTAKTVLGR